MQNLFLSLLRDKSFTKRVEILKYLHSVTVPVSIQDIVKTLKLSPTTIRNGIQGLNHELEEYIEISPQRFGMYLLIMKKNVSIETIITILTQEIPEYKIIDRIFHNRIYDIYDAADELNTSRSTLLRTITHMNKVLAKFKLSIGSDTIRLKGREEDIRFFLYSFFSLFGDSKIVYEQAEADAQLFIGLAEDMHLEKLRYSHYNMTIWLSILRVRWKNECFIESTSELNKILADNTAFAAFKELSDRFLFKANFNVKLAFPEVAWAYINLLHCVTYSSTHSSNENVGNYRYLSLDLPPAVLESTHNLIDEALPGLSPESDTYLKLEAFIINMYLLSKISSNYGIIADDIIHYFKAQYESTYHKWYGLLCKYRKKRAPISFEHLEDAASCLTTISASASKLDVTKQLRIVFALQGPVGLDEYIMETSKQLFTKNIKVDYFFVRAVYKEEINYRRVDLVVTNYDLYLEEEPTYPIIRMSNFPTNLDWSNFRKTLIKLSREKENEISG
ncbi:MAG: helix-turn-helix domain-containing protein [Lachnospiraceae bacterium]|nr:helix-turn-helix domain-containing protein [Lachnospiraceae bacterium]